MAQSAIVEEGTVHEHAHPGELTYIKVAVILAIITMVEVAIWYIDWMQEHHFLVPSLLILSGIKFTAVVGYFMHLKFDDRRFTYLFGSGLAVAASIILAIMALFHWHGIEYVTKLL
ncbi:MAG: cytochrome C oxidase subunit IV family protein [Thermomicrobiales bacterium]|jgi:cytochrome c oxidase subunit 4